MDVRAIGWSGIVQITAVAGAPFYSFGQGLGKHGTRGGFGRKGGFGPVLPQMLIRTYSPPTLARSTRRRRRCLGLQQQQQTIPKPHLHLPILNGQRPGIIEDGVDQRSRTTVGSIQTQLGFNNFISWSGLDIGRDRSSPVSHYEAPFEFTGQLLRVTVEMHPDQKLDGEGVGAAEMARQ